MRGFCEMQVPAQEAVHGPLLASEKVKEDPPAAAAQPQAPAPPAVAVTRTPSTKETPRGPGSSRQSRPQGPQAGPHGPHNHPQAGPHRPKGRQQGPQGRPQGRPSSQAGGSPNTHRVSHQTNANCAQVCLKTSQHIVVPALWCSTVWRCWTPLDTMACAIIFACSPWYACMALGSTDRRTAAVVLPSKHTVPYQACVQ